MKTIKRQTCLDDLELVNGDEFDIPLAKEVICEPSYTPDNRYMKEISCDQWEKDSIESFQLLSKEVRSEELDKMWESIVDTNEKFHEDETNISSTVQNSLNFIEEDDKITDCSGVEVKEETIQVSPVKLDHEDSASPGKNISSLQNKAKDGIDESLEIKANVSTPEDDSCSPKKEVCGIEVNACDAEEKVKPPPLEEIYVPADSERYSPGLSDEDDEKEPSLDVANKSDQKSPCSETNSANSVVFSFPKPSQDDNSKGSCMSLDNIPLPSGESSINDSHKESPVPFVASESEAKDSNSSSTELNVKKNPAAFSPEKDSNAQHASPHSFKNMKLPIARLTFEKQVIKIKQSNVFSDEDSDSGIKETKMKLDKKLPLDKNETAPELLKSKDDTSDPALNAADVPTLPLTHDSESTIPLKLSTSKKSRWFAYDGTPGIKAVDQSMQNITSSSCQLNEAMRRDSPSKLDTLPSSVELNKVQSVDANLFVEDNETANERNELYSSKIDSSKDEFNLIINPEPPSNLTANINITENILDKTEHFKEEGKMSSREYLKKRSPKGNPKDSDPGWEEISKSPSRRSHSWDRGASSPSRRSPFKNRLHRSSPKRNPSRERTSKSPLRKSPRSRSRKSPRRSGVRSKHRKSPARRSPFRDSSHKNIYRSPSWERNRRSLSKQSPPKDKYHKSPLRDRYRKSPSRDRYKSRDKSPGWQSPSSGRQLKSPAQKSPFRDRHRKSKSPSWREKMLHSSSRSPTRESVKGRSRRWDKSPKYYSSEKRYSRSRSPQPSSKEPPFKSSRVHSLETVPESIENIEPPEISKPKLPSPLGVNKPNWNSVSNKAVSNIKPYDLQGLTAGSSNNNLISIPITPQKYSETSLADSTSQSESNEHVGVDEVRRLSLDDRIRLELGVDTLTTDTCQGSYNYDIQNEEYNYYQESGQFSRARGVSSSNLISLTDWNSSPTLKSNKTLPKLPNGSSSSKDPTTNAIQKVKGVDAAIVLPLPNQNTKHLSTPQRSEESSLTPSSQICQNKAPVKASVGSTSLGSASYDQVVPPTPSAQGNIQDTVKGLNVNYPKSSKPTEILQPVTPMTVSYAKSESVPSSKNPGVLQSSLDPLIQKFLANLQPTSKSLPLPVLSEEEQARGSPLLSPSPSYSPTAPSIPITLKKYVRDKTEAILKRKEEKEKRKKDKEIRHLKRQQKLDQKLQRQRALMKEGFIKSTEIEEDEEEPSSSYLQDPSALDLKIKVLTSDLYPPAGKSILCYSGFGTDSSRNMDVKKCVSFADGIKPGEGSSPVLQEDHKLSPPPSKASNTKKKRKVKVRIVRMGDEEGWSPPPPPPGTPPPEAYHTYCTPDGFVYSTAVPNNAELITSS